MITIDKAACVGCGKCVADCVSQSLEMKEGKANYFRECISCGHCVAICPAGAVSIPAYDMQDVGEPGNRLEIGTLLDTIRFRRSVRHYAEKKVEREKLENIVQAGRYTATAVNRQACKFVLVQDNLDTLKNMVWDGVEKAVASSEDAAKSLGRLVQLRQELSIDYLFRNAPAVLYIAAENVVDAGLAAQNMELAAVAQGLGTLYNGYLVHATNGNQPLGDWLQLEGKPIAVCMLLGYPGVDYRRTAPRKKADAVWL